MCDVTLIHVYFYWKSWSFVLYPSIKYKNAKADDPATEELLLSFGIIIKVKPKNNGDTAEFWYSTSVWANKVNH